MVSMIGGAPDSIEEVNATFLNFDSKDHAEAARDFLVKVAKTVYRGKDAFTAYEWVRDNAGGTADANFHDVEFHIANGGSEQLLRIRLDPAKYKLF